MYAFARSAYFFSVNSAGVSGYARPIFDRMVELLRILNVGRVAAILDDLQSGVGHQIRHLPSQADRE